MDDSVSSRDSDAFSYLRKESLDIYNRLHSIEEDISFVQQIHEAYPDTPLLPNLRCGAWYTSPEIATDVPAYFKSTDGHNNNWGFNLRRANLHLLDLISDRHSVILVDSTRSGKRLPDALSKTVPIWCAVINRALVITFPELKNKDDHPWNTALYTPPAVVSLQEHYQIEQRLDGWAQALAASSFTLPMLPGPLRPLWITPATSAFPKLPNQRGEIGTFLPVICVSASKQIDQGVERRSSGFSYVQGSGDDHELWGMGLTPTIFWKHFKELLALKRPEISELVTRIVSQEGSLSSNEIQIPPTPVTKVGGRLLLLALEDVPAEPSVDNMKYLILSPLSQQTTASKHYIPLVSGKRGQFHFLQVVLPTSMDFIRMQLCNNQDVCVAGDSGKDASVGVVLAALSLFFNEDGTLKRLANELVATDTGKQSIRTRLEWIIASRPQANPSRLTLKRVNEFLLTPPSLRRATSPTT